MCKIKTLITILAAALLWPLLSQAAPYASCITNNAGTITFHLNESGGNVTITYDNGTSTDPNYDGITTGTNMALGAHTFNLGSHTNYSISVFKQGTGKPSLINDSSISGNTNYMFILGNLRGIAVNPNPTSPYFGNVYFDRYSAGLIYQLNSDGSFISSNSAGVTWAGTSSPYRISIDQDNYLEVGDYSSAGAAIWRVAPNLSSAQLLLGPVGDANGTTAGVHGEVFSKPLVIGSLTSGNPVTLMEIDNDFPYTDPNTQPNNLLIFTNVTLAALPWQNPPDVVGPEVGLNIQYLNNVYPGLTRGPNGYIYASEQRANYVIPDVYIFDATGTNMLWNSWYGLPATTNDYFLTDTGDGIANAGIVDSAVSPDGKYLVGLAIDNHFTICPLTNGIPDVSKIFTVTPTSYAENARGICWDAADNIYNISSGTAWVQTWSLGNTTTYVTTGDANGVTGFAQTSPTVAVSATDPLISQSNSNGYPTNSSFTITRTGGTGSPLTVNYSFSGTATGTGSYPACYTAGATGSVILAPGQSSTNITITALTDGIARPMTMLTLTLSSSPTYSIALPGTASMNILNTTTPNKLVASINVPTMYNAFSNDYASLTITRWGDTNAATFSANNFTFSGTAVEGTDYTMPTPVTFNPGDLTQVSYIHPLINGQLPVHTNNMVYTGNKTALIAVASGSGFTGSTNTAALTIIDSANPPETVLFSDPLTNADDATNWAVTAANGNEPTDVADVETNFGYDLQNGGLSNPMPLPPNGAATALRVTANKNPTLGYFVQTAVNLYLKNHTFSGNYAVRYNMNLIEGGDYNNSTEGVLLGINHNGLETNWWAGNTLTGTWTTWASDGIWYWISADGGTFNGDYYEFSGNGGALPNTGWMKLAPNEWAYQFANAFKTNVFTAWGYPGEMSGGPGLISNGPTDGDYAYGNTYDDSSWADVEIKQFNGVVTLSVNKTPIFTYTNTTAFTNGTIMLGYEDPYNLQGTPDAAVYFSNLRVVSLAPSGPPTIGEATVNNANSTFVMDFTCTDSSLTTSSFTVQSSATVNGTYTDVAGATITQLGSNAFQAVVPVSGSIQFYRIKQQ